MELIYRAAAVAAVGAVLGLVLKRSNPELALLLGAALAAVTVCASLKAAGEILGFLRGLTETAGIVPAHMSVVLKAVCMATAARLAADVCRDAGQTAAASAVEMAGAVGALYAALPLMESVMASVRGFV